MSAAGAAGGAGNAPGSPDATGANGGATNSNGQAQSNKPKDDAKSCKKSKKPSSRNKAVANGRPRRRADGSYTRDASAKAKCPVCGNTPASTGQELMNKALQRGDMDAANYWKNNPNPPLQADHIYPASAIKAQPGFGELEKKDPRKARALLTHQNNMVGLCFVCNNTKREFGYDKLKDRAKDPRVIKVLEERQKKLGGFFQQQIAQSLGS